MADDGMLLNFSTAETPLLISKPVFKGGRWRDRLTARKAALRRESKIVRYAHSPNLPAAERKVSRGAFDPGFPNPNRPTKRQRLDSSGLPHVVVERDRSTLKSASNTSSSIKDRSGQIVSSLFTYNPAPVTATNEQASQPPELDVEPSNAPLKSELDTFTSLGLSDTLARHMLTKLELKAPTAIQKIAVTQLLKDDSDAFIQAETGSGKTLAYLLPIVQRIMSITSAKDDVDEDKQNCHTDRHSGLFAIILAPTRELCKQILIVLENLLRCVHWIVAGSVAGGEKKKSEKARLRKGINILVATPGRLVDHIAHTESLDISKVRWLVLDEGDKLMELGFEEQIQKIISRLNLQLKAHSNAAQTVKGLPTKRITVLCSATMRMNVQRLGVISLKSAVYLVADTNNDSKDEGNVQSDEQFLAPAQLKQAYTIVAAKLRLVTLIALLRHTFARRGSVMKAIVFLSCADSVDFHFGVLTKQDQGAAEGEEDTELKEAIPSSNQAQAPAVAISGIENPVELYKLHGSLPQSLRTETLKSFTKNPDPSVLVCTDVASRGLDLPNVDFVIEYDPPFSREDHLHRIGRTARAGRDGRALIFLLPGDEEGYLQILKESCRGNGSGLTCHEANEILKKGFHSENAKDGWKDRATQWQLDIERWTLQDPDHLEAARRAYQSHIRAYATHIAAERHIFNIKSLHLGHLAKAFALRDQPGNIRVPGLRPGKGVAEASKLERKAKAKAKASGREGNHTTPTSGRQTHQVVGTTEAQEAARKMKAKSREQMRGVSEFNLG